MLGGYDMEPATGAQPPRVWAYLSLSSWLPERTGIR